MQRRLSAIVPALDEELAIGATLERLVAVADEVLVADGGSRDRTRELARTAGAVVVETPRGRARQMNEGARRARGEVLLFVHADTLVPPGARAAIAAALDRGALGGAFELRFDARGLAYRLGERAASLRSRWSRLAFGDQAQFLLRETFERLGGFADWPLLEDLDLARRLRAAGRVAILRPPVVTSARRFERLGPVRTVLRNWRILRMHARGVPPERLAEIYRR